jgi:histidinol-phosphatase (PHP family)
MIEEDKPTFLGRLDKIKMYTAGSIVEMNTRGYYRYNQPDLYPGEWIIEQLALRDIPVLISSDAHKPEEITKGMGYAAMKKKKLGIQKICVLNPSGWNQYPFSEKGINLAL